MSPYFFVLPTVIAILPILFIFKISVERLKEDPNKFQKAYVQFLIWTAIFEVITILLIVFAFKKTEFVSNISDFYMPGLIIILTSSFAAFFVFLQMKVDVVEDSKEVIQRLSFLAFMMMQAIPLVSIVGLLTMMPDA